MSSNHRMQKTLAAAAIVAGFAAPAGAAVVVPVPQPTHHGDVSYVSGGFGLGERSALEATAGNYNLEITNANRRGKFTAGADLVIRGRGGHHVVRASDMGPLFYAKLPPGDYTIRATSGDQTNVRHVKIAVTGSTDVHLIWPQAS